MPAGGLIRVQLGALQIHTEMFLGNAADAVGQRARLDTGRPIELGAYDGAHLVCLALRRIETSIGRWPSGRGS